MRSLTPWLENRELLRFRSEMDRLFDRFFDWRPFRRSEEDGVWMPLVDVSETGEEIVVNAEIPGMDAKDMDIFLNGRLLTLRGEKKSEHKEKEANFHRMECRYGAFQRTLELPTEVDADRAQATYREGVLKISLPKSGEQSAKKIEIRAS